MRKVIFISLALLASVAVYTQASGLNSLVGAVFAWEKTTHEFGQITQGVPVKAEFVFTNVGDAPLVISNAKGSCGCTVPSYPQQPIPPGQEAKIVAEFNAANVGVFTKTVTITSNTNKQVILTIKGEVVAKNN